MKTSFFSILAAASLLATSIFAATPTASSHDRDEHHPTQQGPYARNDKDFNYGFDKKHKVTPEERKRWEDAHKNDRKDDRKEDKDDRKDRKEDYKDDRKDERKDRKDDRKDKDFNYGFEKSHKVTPQERARWEETHRNNHR